MKDRETSGYDEEMEAAHKIGLSMGYIVGRLVRSELEKASLLEIIYKRDERIRDLEDRVAEEQKIDPKTGLLHKDSFQEIVEAKMNRVHRSGRRISDRKSQYLILADLDDFKQINSSLGLQATDEQGLLPFVDVLHESVREDRDMVGRFGGEEFLVFIDNVDFDTALGVALRIREKANQLRLTPPDDSQGVPVRDYLGVSMGITLYEPGAAYDDVFRQAENALEEAKSTEGKNTIIFAQ